MAFLVSCSLLAYIKLYTITWTENTEPDLSHYNIFIWEGTDTTLCTWAVGDVLTPADPTFRKQVGTGLDVSTVLGVADGQTYISCALTAVDFSGNTSTIGWATVWDNPNSHFLLSKDNTPPANPKDGQIKD